MRDKLFLLLLVLVAAGGLLLSGVDHSRTVGLELTIDDGPTFTGYAACGYTCFAVSNEILGDKAIEFVPMAVDPLRHTVTVNVYATFSRGSHQPLTLIETVTVNDAGGVNLRRDGIDISLRLLSIGQAPPDPAGASGTGSENDWAG